MKKSTLFFACLCLLTLVGMLCSGLRAQETTEAAATYPVSLYGLTTTAEAPAHPESGWTEFVMPTLSGEERDTLNKTYLSTAAAPQNIETATEVTLEAIGFDFPYGGRKMTHFGLTGNGLIYLGAAEADAEATEVKKQIQYVDVGTLAVDITDVIVATFRARPLSVSLEPAQPHFVADNQTKIGYCRSADGQSLVLGFRDILVSFTNTKIDYNSRCTYDVILYQDGRIMLHPITVEIPSKANLLFCVYGLFGQKSEPKVFATDWNGGNIVFDGNINNKQNRMEVTTQTLQSVLTYTLPENCVTPVNVKMAADVPSKNLHATDFSATLQLTEGTCDGWVAFVADNDQVNEHPEDGKTYLSETGTAHIPDSIGGFPIKIVGTDDLISVKGVKAGSTCYIYVYPYNARCLGGPLYQREPVVIPVQLAVGGPVVETAAVGETAVTFDFPELAVDAKVLVGIARRDYRDEKNTRYEMAGISGREKAYEVGDTLFKDLGTAVSSRYNEGPYIITVAHVGTVENGRLTIADLEPGTPYYFYFWTALAGENQYSAEYVAHSIYTTATTPHTFTFETDRVPVTGEALLPAGWHSSEGMDVPFVAGTYFKTNSKPEGSVNGLRALGVMLNQKEVMQADVITPAFRATQADMDVRYRIAMQLKATLTSLVSLGSEDTLSIWYKAVDETEWTRASIVTDDEELHYDASDYAPLRMSIRNVPTDRDIQLRFMIKAMPATTANTAKIFVLHHVLVEPHLRCAYPENIAVSDSLTTHRFIGLTWEEANTAAMPVVYRYRETGSAVWSVPRLAQRPTACEVGTLRQHTAYEIALQTVCREGDSSLVKTISASTLRGLPYKQALTDLAAFPVDFASRQNKLPETGKAITAPLTGMNGFTANRYSWTEEKEEGGKEQHTAAGTTFYIYNTAYWLMLPGFSMENEAAEAEYTFQYKAYYRQNQNTEPTAVDAASPFHVFVLVSNDGSFGRDNIVDTLKVADMSLDYRTYTLDLSAYKRQVYVALCAENTATDNKRAYSFFVIDSLKAHYKEDMQVSCYPVENIVQSDLTRKSITLSWDGYALEYGIMMKNESTGHIDTVYTTATTYTFTALEPGTLYTYRIQGYCDEGHRSSGALSEAESFMTILCYPVENIVQSDLTRNGITLSWDGYALEYGIMMKNESTGHIDTVYTTATTYTFTALEPGTLYTYRIQGYCDEGHQSPGILSEENFFTTFDICAEPSNVAVLGTTWQSVTLTAQATGTKLVHVWAKDTADKGIDYIAQWTSAKDTVTFRGLSERIHIAYYVALRNVCSADDSSAWTEPLEFTTDMPECAAPTELKCGAVGADYAELSWTAGKNNDYFRLMYRPASARKFDTIQLTETAYRLTDLQAKTAYVWQLQAIYDNTWASPVAKGANFTTQNNGSGEAVELTSRFSGLKVGVQNGRIAVWNADALPIDRVEVYALTGRRLYGADFGAATDHLLLPVLGEGSRMVLVRIFSKGETAVYKIVLL